VVRCELQYPLPRWRWITPELAQGIRPSGVSATKPLNKRYSIMLAESAALLLWRATTGNALQLLGIWVNGES